VEVWEGLLREPNLYDKLWDIYSDEFLIPFAERFDRNPHPVELTKGVFQTARAYLYGKWMKEVERSTWLKNSGVHLVSAGFASRQLSYALRQLSKSRPAVELLQERMYGNIQGGTREHARASYRTANRRGGPAAQLLAIEELAASLEEAITSIVPTLGDYEDEDDARQIAIELPEYANERRLERNSQNYPLELAAETFQHLWEDYSTLPYLRGGYKHTLGDYDSKPAQALHAIIQRLDSTVAPSLTGTAIENVRSR